MVQLAGVALLSVGAILVVRELKPNFVFPIRLAVTLFFFCAALVLYLPILERVKALFSLSGAADYGAPLLRATGIALICEITAAFCRDWGESTVADGVLLFGKLEILVLCLPLVDDVLKIAKELLKF